MLIGPCADYPSYSETLASQAQPFQGGFSLQNAKYVVTMINSLAISLQARQAFHVNQAALVTVRLEICAYQ